MKKVLLYSGGMDSWLIDKLWKPDVKLYINVNSRYAKEEIKRLPSDVTILNFDLSAFEREDAIIPMRNLFFVTIASNYGEEICLGATAGDRVLDKSPEFAEKASDLLSYLWQPQHWTAGKPIKVNVDFKNSTKTEMLLMFKAAGGNLKEAFTESFSCYNPDHTGKECWACKPCFRKLVAFYNAGYTEFMNDTCIINSVVGHLENEIIPQINAETYNRGKEEEQQILRFYADCLTFKNKC